MDVERYREVDAKIGRIHWVQRSSDGRQVTFRFTPRLGPVLALLRSTQQVTRHGERALVIRPTPSWTDRLARFEGSGECCPHRDGVRVRRRLEFWLTPVLRPLLGPRHRRRDTAGGVPAWRSATETAPRRDPSPCGRRSGTRRLRSGLVVGARLTLDPPRPECVRTELLEVSWTFAPRRVAGMVEDHSASVRQVPEQLVGCCPRPGVVCTKDHGDGHRDAPRQGEKIVASAFGRQLSVGYPVDLDAGWTSRHSASACAAG